jgi:hypothetical protein
MHNHLRTSLLLLTAILAWGNTAVASYVNPSNGHEYFLTPVVSSWFDARSYAVGQSGYLASVTSQAELDWIKNTFPFPKVG